MKVMYVVKVFAVWGGLERVWTDKMNALSEQPGYEVCLITTDQGDHQVPYPLSCKVRHIDLGVRFVRQYHYGFLRRLWVRWRLTRLFRDRLEALLRVEAPDVLITTASEFAKLLVSSKGDIPLVVESHGLFSRPVHMQRMTWMKRLQTFFLRRAIARAEAVVALTRQDARQWETLNPHSLAIPNLVRLSDGDSYSTCQNRRVIFVGRPDAQKGFQYLREIWEKVSLRHPDWQLHIYGEGLERAENRCLAPQGENVIVHPQTDDILTCYQDSSVLILTSVYEPFGLVMPEAMSCGIPVVAFNCPYGPAEVITDGKDGFLVDCFDTDAFADRLGTLMDDEKLRIRMGQAGVASAQRYSRQQILPRWMSLFEKLQKNR